MTEAPETIYLAHADTATEYGVKITEALKPHGYPRGAIEYTRADLARPVTVAEAAKVLLGDVLDENGSEQWDNLSMTQESKVVCVFRALSHEGGE